MWHVWCNLCLFHLRLCHFFMHPSLHPPALPAYFIFHLPPLKFPLEGGCHPVFIFLAIRTRPLLLSRKRERGSPSSFLFSNSARWFRRFFLIPSPPHDSCPVYLKIMILTSPPNTHLDQFFSSFLVTSSVTFLFSCPLTFLGLPRALFPNTFCTSCLSSWFSF